MQVTVRDITMSVEASGTAGPALLLVHGLGGCARVWEDVVPPLAAGARVFVPDLRGCGASSRGSAEYSLACVAEDLAVLIDELRLERVVAVGHSLGGVIVQEMMTRGLGSLAGAVLVSTSSRLSPAATANWRKLADVVETRGLSSSPAAQARSFSEQFAAERPEVLAAHAALGASADPRVYAEQARAASEYDYTEALARVTVPTLILQGLADRLTPPGGSVILQRAIPGSRLEMIEGAGHNLPIEMPERFAALVLDFAAAVAG